MAPVLEAKSAEEGDGTNSSSATAAAGKGQNPACEGQRPSNLSEEDRRRIREKAEEARMKTKQRLQRQQLEMPPPPPPSPHPIHGLLCSFCRSKLELNAGSESYHCSSYQEGCKFRLIKWRAELPELKIMFVGVEVTIF